MRLFALFIIIVATAFLARMAYVILPAAGVFSPLKPVLVDQCKRLDVAPGTEDVTVDLDLGRAFISAADRRAWFENPKTARPAGAIYAVDLANLETLRQVSPEGLADFSPHGISHWRSDNGDLTRLFVINHSASGRESVEIFAVANDGALTHLESVAFPAMFSPNDVVAVGARRFYATNDRRYDGGVPAQLEAYLGLPLVDVVYYDGAGGRSIANRLTYANGINVSADGKMIYVAEFLRRQIRVYERDRVTGALTPFRTFPVDLGPDNIEVAPDGALYIGGHPNAFAFLQHAKDAANIAPSKVVRLDPESGDVKDVFVATNGEINGSSVGAVTNHTLVVGAVFDGHVMICPLTPRSAPPER